MHSNFIAQFMRPLIRVSVYPFFLHKEKRCTKINKRKDEINEMLLSRLSFELWSKRNIELKT